MMLMAERQSARMSKITNDGLTRSAWHRMLYSCTHMATTGVVKELKIHMNRTSGWMTHKFQMLDFFLPGPVWAAEVPWIRSGCSRDARIISVHRTASCSSISRSLYWLRSINTRAISTRVNRLRWAIGTSSYSRPQTTFTGTQTHYNHR